jgi:hypothetical protein
VSASLPTDRGQAVTAAVRSVRISFVSALPNDAHTTDGRHYTIPAHPEMIAAIGRVVWTFLTLEETAVAILFETGTHSLGDARQLTMGKKETALKGARKRLSDENAPAEVLQLMDRGRQAFRRARLDYRNPLCHAGLFTVGYEDDGTYLPGVSLKSVRGKRQHICDAEAMHAMALSLEGCCTELNQARTAVREFRRL